MEVCNACPSISKEDLRAAIKDLKTYVDITEEDLMKIYGLAVRHARVRRSTMITVESVMTRKVICATRNMNIHEAARILSKNKISGMPVVDEENRVVGVISLADILSPEGTKKESRLKAVIRTIAGSGVTEVSDGKQVGEVMKTPPITTEPDADIKEVAAILDLYRIKRLPVVDLEKNLIGIISRGDIIRAMGMKQ